MARKTAVYAVTGDPETNRDAGKTFLITEMSARAAESWAYRAFGAMVHAGIDIPPEVIATGMSGMSMVGLKAFLAAPWDEAEPLLAELMGCARVITDVQAGDGSGSVTRPLVDRGEDGDDIEEVSTRTRLKDEVLKLHTGFSIADALLTGVSAIQELLFSPSPSIPTPGS